MCEYCLSSPCLSGCPMESDDDKKNTNKCSFCGSFFDEDNGVVTDSGAFCDDCIEKLDIEDILQIAGADSVKELISSIA